MMGSTADLGIIESDQRLFTIINALQELDGAGVTELANYLEMPKSTVHKHLKTLQHERYVRQRDGTYSLGFKFLQLGGHIQQDTEVISISKPYIIKYAKKLDELVTLAIKEHNRGVFAFSHNDKYDLISEYTPDKTQYSFFSLYCGAAGKAILAQLNDSEVTEIIGEQDLVELTENTITDTETLLLELEEVRSRGYALNRGERHEEIQGIAKGFYHSREDLYASISITGPSSHFTDESQREHYIESLSTLVNEIEIALEFGHSK